MVYCTYLFDSSTRVHFVVILFCCKVKVDEVTWLVSVVSFAMLSDFLFYEVF